MIFVGRDSRIPLDASVCAASLAKTSPGIKVEMLDLEPLQRAGFYKRPTENRGGVLWDVISNAPMSTEFALSRFFVPFLRNYSGFAAFVDGDFLFLDNAQGIFDAAFDENKAVYVVKQEQTGDECFKREGQPQEQYSCKNWSSLMVFNCGHPANKWLNLDNLNTVKGLFLHQFQWLKEGELGFLPPRWNVLDREIGAYHYTLGTPRLPEKSRAPFADLWLEYARGQYAGG